jgi:hypothetical protein
VKCNAGAVLITRTRCPSGQTRTLATGEAWRIDAYIIMMAAAAKAGWSEGFERLEGRLLGYEEWQTDLHLERLRAGPHAKKFFWLRRP